MKKTMTLKQFATLGGLARAKKLSPERRKEIAQKGVAAKAMKRAVVYEKGAE